MYVANGAGSAPNLVMGKVARNFGLFSGGFCAVKGGKSAAHLAANSLAGALITQHNK